MSTKLHVEIGTFERDYTLIETDAPRAYDGFGAIQIYEGPRDGGTIRYVLVEDEHLEWQEGRNRSGLHTFEIPEEDLTEYAQKELHTRLIGRDRT